MELGPDRVHVAPVGSERDRISRPAIENGADKAGLPDYLGEEESVGRNKRVTLTRAGEQTLTVFRHAVTGEKPSLEL